MYVLTIQKNYALIEEYDFLDLIFVSVYIIYLYIICETFSRHFIQNVVTIGFYK